MLANPVQEATDAGEVDGAADAALQAVRDDAVLQPLTGLLLRTDEGATFGKKREDIIITTTTISILPESPLQLELRSPL